MSCVDEEDEEEEECSVLSPSDISPFEAVALLPAPSSSTR